MIEVSVPRCARKRDRGAEGGMLDVREHEDAGQMSSSRVVMSMASCRLRATGQKRA